MPAPQISPLPEPPRRTMAPTDFISAADAWVAAMPAFQTEANILSAALTADAAQVATQSAQVTADAAAVAAAVITAGVIATSVTPYTIGGATPSLVVQTGKLFVPGIWVTVAYRPDPTKSIVTKVKAYDGVTGVLDLLTPPITSGAGNYSDWQISLAAVPAGLGTFALWIPAAAMVTRTTSGAGYGVVETATNKIMLRTLDFDASAIEYAQFAIRMPKSWDLGTVTFVPEWSHPTATTNFKVSWGLQAVAVSDGDALDAAFGTAMFSNDTGGTADRAYAGPASAAITIAGAPASEDLVIYQVFRKADDAVNDTLGVDARLQGVTLFIQTNAGSDA